MVAANIYKSWQLKQEGATIPGSPSHVFTALLYAFIQVFTHMWPTAVAGVGLPSVVDIGRYAECR